MTPELVTRLLRRFNRIAIVSHHRPDTDSLGSAIGLSHLLRSFKIESYWLSERPLPDSYHFLGPIEHQTILDSKTEAIVLLDCPKLELTSFNQALRRATKKLPLILIDHHRPEKQITPYCLIDPAASSTAELIARLISPTVRKTNQKLATALLLGIYSDSLVFGAKGAERCFSVASRLIKLGADVQTVRNLLHDRLPTHQRLADLFERIEISRYQLAVLRLSEEEQDERQLTTAELSKLAVNLATNLKVIGSIIVVEGERKIEGIIRMNAASTFGQYIFHQLQARGSARVGRFTVVIGN